MLGRVDGIEGWHSTDRTTRRAGAGVVVFRWEAPLFFANAGVFRQQIRHLVHERRPRWVVLQCEAITDIDVTAAGHARAARRRAERPGRAHGVRRAAYRLQDLVRRYGLLETLDRDHFYPAVDAALDGDQAGADIRGTRVEGGTPRYKRHGEADPGGRRDGARSTTARPAARDGDVRARVDTSLMNVSISAVVEDLDTTVSGVQSAIALEALVSAAFILIGSKVGDLIGRKRAYVLGLLGYAIGALAMTLAQSLAAIIVFWALIGGLGASLLLPAMQSLIHGNFEGAAQKRSTRWSAPAAIAAAIGPLLGGFITTYLSWRVGFLLELLVIAVVLSGVGRVKDVAYTGSREVDPVGAVLSVLGMGGVVLGILAWQEGGDAVAELLIVGAVGLVALACLAGASQARGEADPARPRLVPIEDVPVRDLGADAPEHRARRRDDRAADLPADGARVRRDADGPHRSRRCRSRCSAWPCSPGRRRDRGARAASSAGLRPAVARHGPADLGRAQRRLGLVPLRPAADRGAGLGLLVSQLNNYTLSPITEERVSEAAGVNSASGSFGLSFGLAFAGAIMLATLSITFTDMAESSAVLTPAEQQQVATGLEDDAELMSNTALEELLVGQPKTSRTRSSASTRGSTVRAAGGAARAAPRRAPRADLVGEGMGGG